MECPHAVVDDTRLCVVDRLEFPACSPDVTERVLGNGAGEIDNNVASGGENFGDRVAEYHHTDAISIVRQRRHDSSLVGWSSRRRVRVRYPGRRNAVSAKEDSA